MKLKLTLILDENDAPDSTKTVDTPGGAVTLNAVDCGFTMWDVTPDEKPEVKPVDNGVNA